MPSYKGHLCAGILFYCVALTLFIVPVSLLTKSEWLLCVLLGSLFPDIDTKSKGQKLFYFLLLCILIIFIVKKQFLYAAFSSVVGCLPLLVRHRGIFHSLWFLIVLISVFIFSIYCCVPDYITIALYDSYFFLLGIISHIFLDKGLGRFLK